MCVGLPAHLLTSQSARSAHSSLSPLAAAAASETAYDLQACQVKVMGREGLDVWTVHTCRAGGGGARGMVWAQGNAGRRRGHPLCPIGGGECCQHKGCPLYALLVPVGCGMDVCGWAGVWTGEHKEGCGEAAALVGRSEGGCARHHKVQGRPPFLLRGWWGVLGCGVPYTLLHPSPAPSYDCLLRPAP